MIKKPKILGFLPYQLKQLTVATFLFKVRCVYGKRSGTDPSEGIKGTPSNTKAEAPYDAQVHAAVIITRLAKAAGKILQKLMRIHKCSYPPAAPTAPRALPPHPPRQLIRPGVFNTPCRGTALESPGVWHQTIAYDRAGEWTGRKDSYQQKVAEVGKPT